MSTYRYCDGWDGECRRTSDDVNLFSPNNSYVAQALADRGWFCSIYDIHICQECLDTYYNEEDEQIAINHGYLVLGKDFKQKGQP